MSWLDLFQVPVSLGVVCALEHGRSVLHALWPIQPRLAFRNRPDLLPQCQLAGHSRPLRTARHSA